MAAATSPRLPYLARLPCRPHPGAHQRHQRRRCFLDYLQQQTAHGRCRAGAAAAAAARNWPCHVPDEGGNQRQSEAITEGNWPCHVPTTFPGRKSPCRRPRRPRRPRHRPTRSHRRRRSPAPPWPWPSCSSRRDLDTEDDLKLARALPSRLLRLPPSVNASGRRRRCRLVTWATQVPGCRSRRLRRLRRLRRCQPWPARTMSDRRVRATAAWHREPGANASTRLASTPIAGAARAAAPRVPDEGSNGHSSVVAHQ